MEKSDNGLFYCKVCMCQSPTKHSHNKPAKPTLKELFNKQQLSGYLETAHAKPLATFTQKT